MPYAICQNALVGPNRVFAQFTLCGRRGTRQEVSRSTWHICWSLPTPRPYWVLARCHRRGNPSSQELVWHACSAVELSCTLLYLDPVFVKQEDLSDRAPVFHLWKVTHPCSLGFEWRGEEERRRTGFSLLPWTDRVEQGPSTSPAKRHSPWQWSQDTDNGNRWQLLGPGFLVAEGFSWGW